MLSKRRVRTPCSSSLVLPRCLEARPWLGWGSLLPLAPQRAPCPRACLVPGQSVPQSPRGKQRCCRCQQQGFSPPESLPFLMQPGLWGQGVCSSFLLFSTGQVVAGPTTAVAGWLAAPAPMSSIHTALALERVALWQAAPD